MTEYTIIEDLGRYAVIKSAAGTYGVLQHSPNGTFLDTPRVVASNMKQYMAKEAAEKLQKGEK